MNFIYISPQYPPRNFMWIKSLVDRGVTVFGVGDTPVDKISNNLKHLLTKYIYIPSLDKYDDVLKACKILRHDFGQIDYIESNNEWWLNLDAKLRKDLRVPNGLYPEDILKIKSKSRMKSCFKEAGVKTIRYTLVNGICDKNKAIEFAGNVKYPLFLKPDIGVGACSTSKIENESQLIESLNKIDNEQYILEEFVNGVIVSFDGVSDDHSDVVFCNADVFPTPVADMVNNELDEYYYINPFDLDLLGDKNHVFYEIGRRTVKAFDIKKRVFHIEYFILLEDKQGLGKKGDFVALECNMRPAGGYTPDLINFANSLSIFDIYADIIYSNKTNVDVFGEKYYAFSVTRRDKYFYLHSELDVLKTYKDSIVMYGRYPDHLSDAMGNDYFFAKFKKLEDGLKFDEYIRKKR